MVILTSHWYKRHWRTCSIHFQDASDVFMENSTGMQDLRKLLVKGYEVIVPVLSSKDSEREKD